MFLCYPIIDNKKYGRKNSLFYSYLLGGVACLCACIFRGNMFVICLFFARFSINCIFSFLYPLSSEVYHTKVRATGLGMCSAFYALGGIAMPFVSLAAFETSPASPFFVFGASFLVGAWACYKLPFDTAQMELDTKYEQVEMIQRAEF